MRPTTVLRTLPLSAALLLAGACGSSGPTTSDVVAKHLEPSDTESKPAVASSQPSEVSPKEVSEQDGVIPEAEPAAPAKPDMTPQGVEEEKSEVASSRAKEGSVGLGGLNGGMGKKGMATGAGGRGAIAKPKPRRMDRSLSKHQMVHMGPPPPESLTKSAEEFDRIEENAFVAVADDPLSTFSIDVDTAAYANVRRYLSDGVLPPVDAVRIEELVNYFSYDYPAPVGQPFEVDTEVSACPWNDDHLLARVGLQGQVIDQSEVPARNLVFLLDVSGSMNSPDKLPLLKRGLGLLVNHLRPEDKVSIVVYAGASGVVLQPTSDKRQVMDALARLQAGGSTNGGAGIVAAYRLAEQTFIKGGINRVLLATDGDFNVGVSSRTDLLDLIEEKRKSGVFLSVLGFGAGNVKDSTMEQIADKGNGNYAFIDTFDEAKKVLVEEAGATLVTIAKDVKIQVEFNPQEVSSYRLVGYENRKLAHADFNDDTKDAGEIGAGHSVTALYEIVPSHGNAEDHVDPLKYQKERDLTASASSGELMNVKIRYKQPNGSTSQLITHPVQIDDKSMSNTSADFRFAAAVAEFGMLLRRSSHRGKASYDHVLSAASGALGQDRHGHRKGFVKLAEQAKQLDRRQSPTPG